MLTLMLALSLCAGDDDTAATTALDRFKNEYKAKDAGARAAAVTELARTQHEKVWARLGQMLVVDEKEVRIAAAKGLVGVTENRKKAASYLMAATAPNAKEPVVLAAILEALGKVKEALGAPELEKHFKSKQIPVAKAAIEAAGEIGSRSSVEPLIDTLKWLESNAQDAPAYGGTGGAKAPSVGTNGTGDASAKERDAALRPVVLKTLAALTKASHSSVKEWSDWWRSEGAKFMSGK
jgi:hypothetical protein